MGIEPTTSGLDLPLLCRLGMSYEVGQRKFGDFLRLSLCDLVAHFGGKFKIIEIYDRYDASNKVQIEQGWVIRLTVLYSKENN